ncbi:hypothetical protein OGAPHI_005989 [Ogataea philodendri]|uniref:Uncharacterized protein n=1 Tax=Ogataea philodendri TaxID=1378263 RepID=A0A9P8NYY2_9ASCO|nr:uncharacterized protein OGAPHI_005989 [Ogataea philodendri]KAH3661811.1 hypothetical protein OGAPHI_005989 [Ogataea philodendri]
MISGNQAWKVKDIASTTPMHTNLCSAECDMVSLIHDMKSTPQPVSANRRYQPVKRAAWLFSGQAVRMMHPITATVQKIAINGQRLPMMSEVQVIMILDSNNVTDESSREEPHWPRQNERCHGRPGELLARLTFDGCQVINNKLSFVRLEPPGLGIVRSVRNSKISIDSDRNGDNTIKDE